MTGWTVEPVRVDEIYGTGVPRDGFVWAVFGRAITVADIDRLVPNPFEEEDVD